MHASKQMTGLPDRGRRLCTPLIAAFALVLGTSGGGAAQDAVAPPSGGVDLEHRVEALEASLADARSAHLERIAWWGVANVVAGVGLAAGAGSGAPTRRGFGIQTAAWGAVNLGIVGWAALSGMPEPTGTLAGALAAEDGWSHILLVNLGLNVGYMAVGGALWAASTRGLDAGDAVRGHAMAVVLQGAGLLIFDGVAWLSSSERLSALRGVVESLTVAPGARPGSLAVGLHLPLG